MGSNVFVVWKVWNPMSRNQSPLLRGTLQWVSAGCLGGLRIYLNTQPTAFRSAVMHHNLCHSCNIIDICVLQTITVYMHPKTLEIPSFNWAKSANKYKTLENCLQSFYTKFQFIFLEFEILRALIFFFILWVIVPLKLVWVGFQKFNKDNTSV